MLLTMVLSLWLEAGRPAGPQARAGSVMITLPASEWFESTQVVLRRFD
jgi:hypothetical protein